MNVPRYAGNGDLGINMTPMIDVVFLLIIFFLVSSHLARRENEMRLELPSATSSEDPKIDGPRVTLSVLPDGSLFLAGVSVDPHELLTRIQNAKNREGDELEIRIRADRSVAYEHITPILTAAAQSGVWNVHFAVLQQEPAG